MSILILNFIIAFYTFVDAGHKVFSTNKTQHNFQNNTNIDNNYLKHIYHKVCLFSPTDSRAQGSSGQMSGRGNTWQGPGRGGASSHNISDRGRDSGGKNLSGRGQGSGPMAKGMSFCRKYFL